MICINKNKKYEYVTQLFMYNYDDFTVIRNELSKLNLTTEEFNDAMNSRVCDLENTIHIYYTED